MTLYTSFSLSIYCQERLLSWFSWFRQLKGQYLYFYLWDLMKCSMKKADSRQKGRTKGEETPISVMVNLEKDNRRKRRDDHNKRGNGGLTKESGKKRTTLLNASLLCCMIRRCSSWTNGEMKIEWTGCLCRHLQHALQQQGRMRVSLKIQ